MSGALPAEADGVALHALTDPLRPGPPSDQHRRRCDGCRFPLGSVTDCNVWRVGRPNGTVVHLYLCTVCDGAWESNVPRPRGR